MLDALPEFLQPVEPCGNIVAGDKARIDRTDRDPDHPIWFDATLVESFVSAGLVGAKRAAALQNHDELTPA